MATVGRHTFTEADLRAAAGVRSFERGIEYLDAVDGITASAYQIMASVRGSADYEVVLTLPGPDGAGGIRGECTCPQGREGFFCKHCVAVGLAIARNAVIVPAQRGSGRAHARAGAAPAAGERAGAGRLRSWLDSRSRDELLSLIAEQLVEDLEWRRRLELRAAAGAGDLTSVSALMADLLDARELSPYGYLEEGDAWRYARRVREAAAAVAMVVSSGHPSGAIAVAEQAIGAVSRSCRNARDSSGVIRAAAADLAASHLAACGVAPPDAVRLADFLAEHGVRRQDILWLDFAGYADALGAAGLHRLREQLSEAWQASQPGSGEQEALERLLQLMGDTDALVGVIAAGHDEPDRKHLKIARELDRAGRRAEALAWAERGLAESAAAPEELTDFVAERYLAAGRGADALAVRRGRFAIARDLTSYRQLRAEGQRAGTWPAVRDWARDLLRSDATADRGGSGPGPAPAGAVIVDVLIDDGDLDAAWEAARGAASEEQWLRLADLAARTRPADALAVYLRQVAGLRTRTGERAYQRLARLLVSARACHDRLGTQEEFGAYLRALRDEQKRKRRLIAILDARELR
ncbi:MAG TPA: hypothetical protein VF834_10275 [Streptosporangiaceae bacterium]